MCAQGGISLPHWRTNPQNFMVI